MNSDNNSVFIKSELSDMDPLSATSDAFVNDRFSETSDAPIPSNFELGNLETTVSELQETVNNTLKNKGLSLDLENELKRLLTDTENQIPVAIGGSKKYRLNEGKASGKYSRGVKSYETEFNEDLNVETIDKKAVSEFSMDESSDMENENEDMLEEVSEKSNKPRKERKNDPLKPHRDFVAHIQKVMGVKGGPALQVLAKMYKDKAKEANPDKSSIEQTNVAQKIFDEESEKERESKYQKALKKLAEKKSSK